MSKSSGTVEKRFFPGGYKCQYSAELPLAPTFVPQLYDTLLGQSEIKGLLEQPRLENLKGRDSRQHFIQPSPPPTNNELLLASGMLRIPSGPEVPPEPFSFSLLTPYEGSKRSRMFHTLREERTADLPAEIHYQHAGRIIPAELTFFRFGLQKYTPRMFSHMFGISPIITGSLLLDCSTDRLHIEISEEGLSRTELPWKNSPVLVAVDVALRAICHFDLLADMRAKLKTQ